ncbi:Tetratricopeptide repeat protein [Spironucleus salmonicida]|uniref:Outer dynein arm-docking complex subunit 4 n=1 Tax=Spironucleus salmonicida TaxID=348837 RepID=V6LT96_9EUKA|nr:Tetratricopeptide repeat protein [Spironucleus salmonicida]|eukprot:EST46916.1 Tetratricopeptide repeat protein [Spironucleus salmonicida]
MDSKKIQADLLLREAEQAYRIQNFNKAITSLTYAIELSASFSLYNFRSKCYTAASYTDQAIQDANTAIKFNKDSHEGYFCRAEAEFFKGEFELALVDYSVCQFKRSDIQEHRRGINKCEESIRKACEIQNVDRYVQLLDQGVLIEKSLQNPGENIVIEIYQGPLDFVPSENATGIENMTGIGNTQNIIEEVDPFEILDIPSDRVYRSISQKARRSVSYNRIGKMAEDREFLKEIAQLDIISSITSKGIGYIDQREDFWRNQDSNNSKPKSFNRNRKSVLPSASKSPIRAQSVRQDKIASLASKISSYRYKIQQNDTQQIDRTTFYQNKIPRNPQIELAIKQLSIFVKEVSINITEAVNKQAYDLAIKFSQQLIFRLNKQSDPILNLFQSKNQILADTFCTKACIEIKLNSENAFKSFDQSVDFAKKSGDISTILKVKREHAKALLNVNSVVKALQKFKEIQEICQIQQVNLDNEFNVSRCYFELKEYNQAIEHGVNSYEGLKAIFNNRYPQKELPEIVEFSVFKEPKVCETVCDLLCLLGRSYQQLKDTENAKKWLNLCLSESVKYEDFSSLKAAEGGLKQLGEMGSIPAILGQIEQPQLNRGMSIGLSDGQYMCNDSLDALKNIYQ